MTTEHSTSYCYIHINLYFSFFLFYIYTCAQYLVTICDCIVKCLYDDEMFKSQIKDYLSIYLIKHMLTYLFIAITLKDTLFLLSFLLSPLLACDPLWPYHLPVKIYIMRFNERLNVSPPPTHTHTPNATWGFGLN